MLFPGRGLLPPPLLPSPFLVKNPPPPLPPTNCSTTFQKVLCKSVFSIRTLVRVCAFVGLKAVELKSRLQDTETRSAVCDIAQQYSSGTFIPPVPESHPSLIVCSQQSDGCTRWRSWLRHSATSRKVAGSIPDGIIIFFIDINLPAALWPWDRLSLQQR